MVIAGKLARSPINVEQAATLANRNRIAPRGFSSD